jgi:excisionase family DNA binding protein
MRFLTAQEVSTMLKIPLPRVYEAARRDLMPSIRIGRQVRFDEQALDEWRRQGGRVLRPRSDAPSIPDGSA